MTEVDSGISVVGLQRIGDFNATLNPWQLRFASSQAFSRTTKAGNALVVIPIANNRFPVIASIPVYGGGIAPHVVTEYPADGLELWVSWFGAGYQWIFERPAAV